MTESIRPLFELIISRKFLHIKGHQLATHACDTCERLPHHLGGSPDEEEQPIVFKQVAARANNWLTILVKMFQGRTADLGPKMFANQPDPNWDLTCNQSVVMPSSTVICCHVSKLASSKLVMSPQAPSPPLTEGSLRKGPWIGEQVDDGFNLKYSHSTEWSHTITPVS